MTTTTSQVSVVSSPFYDRLLLERAQPYLMHTLFAQKRPMPRKAGTQISFRRYAALSAATTPLSEGVAPAADQLSVTDITATTDQYGAYVEITDMVDATVEDSVVAEVLELQGEQLGLTVDNIVRDILSSTASAVNCSGGSNGNTPTEVVKSDIDSVVTTMLGNNAQYISEMVNPSTGNGTVPIPPSYFGLADSPVSDDLAAVSGFVSVQEYGQQGPVFQGEWGSTGRVRWLISSEGKVTTESPVQYHMFILGKNAYGMTEIDGGGTEAIIKGFGQVGSDPLNQKSTVGWKMMGFVSRILNDNFIRNLECTHS